MAARVEVEIDVGIDDPAMVELDRHQAVEHGLERVTPILAPLVVARQHPDLAVRDDAHERALSELTQLEAFIDLASEILPAQERQEHGGIEQIERIAHSISPSARRRSWSDSSPGQIPKNAATPEARS